MFQKNKKKEYMRNKKKMFFLFTRKKKKLESEGQNLFQCLHAKRCSSIPDP